MDKQDDSDDKRPCELLRSLRAYSIEDGEVVFYLPESEAVKKIKEFNE